MNSNENIEGGVPMHALGSTIDLHVESPPRYQYIRPRLDILNHYFAHRYFNLLIHIFF